MLVIGVNHEAKDEGEWGLKWTVIGESGNRDNKQVEEKTKCGETDGDAGGSLVDEEKVVGEGITEEESDLEHEEQTLLGNIEAPCIHSLHFA